MPIVKCVFAPECQSFNGDLIELWSKESGVSPDHMTINMIKAEKQLGKAYAIIAELSLPSMWSSEKVDALQTGLARALVQYTNAPIEQIFIITNLVHSGFVVEEGKILNWEKRKQ